MKYDKAKLAATNAQMKALLDGFPQTVLESLEATFPSNATSDYFLGSLDTISNLSLLVGLHGSQPNLGEALTKYLTLRGAVASQKLAELEPKGGELDVIA